MRNEDPMAESRTSSTSGISKNFNQRKDVAPAEFIKGLDGTYENYDAKTVHNTLVHTGPMPMNDLIFIKESNEYY